MVVEYAIENEIGRTYEELMRERVLDKPAMSTTEKDVGHYPTMGGLRSIADDMLIFWACAGEIGRGFQADSGPDGGYPKTFSVKVKRVARKICFMGILQSLWIMRWKLVKPFQVLTKVSATVFTLARFWSKLSRNSGKKFYRKLYFPPKARLLFLSWL